MAALKDIVGAVLGDITRARFMADLETREAGLHYLQDPVLRQLAVPRVNIRNIVLEIPFAVEEVRPEQSDPRAQIRASTERELAKLVGAIGRIEIARAGGLPRQRISELLGEGAARGLNQKGLEALMGLFEEQRLLNLTRENPAEAANEVGAELVRNFEKTLQEEGRLELSEETRAALSKHALQHSIDIVDAARRSIEQSNQRPNLAVEVAVTYEKLTSLPGAAIGKVQITAGVENYEWITTTTEDGETFDRLEPR